MWWGKSKDPKPEGKNEVAQIKDEVAQIKNKVAEKLPTKEQLNHEIHDHVNQTGKNGNVFDDITEGYGPDSTETNLRYAAYATRIRTILLSAHRYVAYTSEIGESFRPVAHPGLVRGAYAVSWLYLIGDVSYEGYKSYWHNQRILNPKLQLTPQQEKVTGLPAVETRPIQPGTVAPLEDWRTVMVQRGIFQSIASMGLPAYTIHTVVRYSGRAMKNMKNKTIRTWGPVGLGLAVVPFLPAMFDEPVENAVEWAFHKGFETFGGKAAVGNAPMTGREDLLAKRPKEKEL